MSGFLKILILGLVAAVLPACRPATVAQARRLLGTRVEITAEGKDRAGVEAKVAAAFGEIGRVEALLSSFREGSELSRINRSAGIEPVAVSPEVLELIERSFEISRASEGAFDISFAALGELWDFSGEKPPRLPEPAEIAKRQKLVGWTRVRVDHRARTVFLPEPGMRLDLGGIAKGYAVDRALEILDVPGIERALINAGGDLRGFARPGQKPWQVGIQDPVRRGRLLGRLEIRNQAVATSGQYERFFEFQGRRYGHILDPRTGRPAEGARSATVKARSAWEADALATALFVLGPARGLALARSRTGVEALIVDRDGRVEMSAGFADRMVLEDQR